MDAQGQQLPNYNRAVTSQYFPTLFLWEGCGAHSSRGPGKARRKKKNRKGRLSRKGAVRGWPKGGK